MQLKHRRLIYLSFIVFFVIAALVVLLYAQGYSYNALKRNLEKTGALAVLSEPPGATVTISNQTGSGTTPLNWSRLSPDQYQVTVELAGYQTWQKKLTVKGGEVTPTGKIRLWPDEKKGTWLTDTAQVRTWQSPNKQNLLYLNTRGLGAGLWLLNLTSGETALLSRAAARQLKYLEWSPTNRQLLIQEPAATTNWQIINLTDNTKQVLTLPLGLTAQTVHWSATDANVLYFTTDHELYELKLNTNTSRLLWRGQIIDFREHQGVLFSLVKQSPAGVGLKILNPKNLQVVPLEATIPLSVNFTFLEAKDDWLPLLDTNRHQLYLLRSPLKSVLPVIKLPEAINLDWLADGTKLLVYNNFEIWQYQLATARLDLIYRVSTRLSQVRWFNEAYIMLASDNELQVLELDIRDQQQRWPLTTQPQPILDFWLEPLGKLVTVHTTGGLFRLPLTTTVTPPDEPPTGSL